MNTTDLHFSSNKVRDIERCCLHLLEGLYPSDEARQLVWMLFEAFLGWDVAQCLLHRDDTVNLSDLLKFHWAVEDLKRHRPIQYVLGCVPFCDCRIAVHEGVLIPRPETEEIVGKVVADLSDTLSNGRVLDCCTGSGCIAVALAKQWSGAEVYGVDISPEALRLARHNAAANGVSVHFRMYDVLLHTGWDAPTFDLIVSNPPYVLDSQRASMRRNVLDFEPHEALFVPDDDPLLFYRAIAAFALCHLAPRGTLVFEINETLASETSALLQSLGFATSLSLDFRGRQRCLVARRNL